MRLAIFDLDNTLIAGDSDHAWGEFLIDKGLVDADAFKKSNDGFYQDYQRGELDIIAYLRFALSPLRQFSMTELENLHSEFMASIIEPIILVKGEKLIAKHKNAGDLVMIITATNSFITAPIAKRLGVTHLLASEAEIIDGMYTGEPKGIPCYQDGKVSRLNDWLANKNYSLQGSYFYSDSANDIPLLQKVDNPVAVDPCPRLQQWAEENSVEVISLR